MRLVVTINFEQYVTMIFNLLTLQYAHFHINVKAHFFSKTRQQATLREFRWTLWMLYLQAVSFYETDISSHFLLVLPIWRLAIFFYRRSVKSKVFEANPLWTFQALKQCILDEIEVIPVKILREVMQSL